MLSVKQDLAAIALQSLMVDDENPVDHGIYGLWLPHNSISCMRLFV